MVIVKITGTLEAEFNLIEINHFVEWKSFETPDEYEKWLLENKVTGEDSENYWHCYPQTVEDEESGRLRDVQVKTNEYSISNLESRPLSFFDSMPFSIFAKIQKKLLDE